MKNRLNTLFIFPKWDVLWIGLLVCFSLFILPDQTQVFWPHPYFLWAAALMAGFRMGQLIGKLYRMNAYSFRRQWWFLMLRVAFGTGLILSLFVAWGDSHRFFWLDGFLCFFLFFLIGQWLGRLPGKVPGLILLMLVVGILLATWPGVFNFRWMEYDPEQLLSWSLIWFGMLATLLFFNVQRPKINNHAGGFSRFDRFSLMHVMYQKLTSGLRYQNPNRILFQIRTCLIHNGRNIVLFLLLLGVSIFAGWTSLARYFLPVPFVIILLAWLQVTPFVWTNSGTLPFSRRQRFLNRIKVLCFDFVLFCAFAWTHAILYHRGLNRFLVDTLGHGTAGPYLPMGLVSLACLVFLIGHHLPRRTLLSPTILIGLFVSFIWYNYLPVQIKANEFTQWNTWPLDIGLILVIVTLGLGFMFVHTMKGRIPIANVAFRT